MSMFNECHIHSCDCTCLNVFSHAQYLLINHKKIFECFRARLVIVFKNCCLKRCENCGLKSVVEKRVFSVNKTKKVFDIMI